MFPRYFLTLLALAGCAGPVVPDPPGTNPVDTTEPVDTTDPDDTTDSDDLVTTTPDAAWWDAVSGEPYDPNADDVSYEGSGDDAEALPVAEALTACMCRWSGARPGRP